MHAALFRGTRLLKTVEIPDYFGDYYRIYYPRPTDCMSIRFPPPPDPGAFIEYFEEIFQRDRERDDIRGNTVFFSSNYHKAPEWWKEHWLKGDA